MISLDRSDLLFVLFIVGAASSCIAYCVSYVMWLLTEVKGDTVTIHYTNHHHDHCSSDTHNIEHHNYPDTDDDGPDGHYFDDLVPMDDPPPVHSASRIAPHLAACTGCDDATTTPFPGPGKMGRGG